MFSGFGDSFGKDLIKTGSRGGQVKLDYENILPDKLKPGSKVPSAQSGLKPLGKPVVPVTVALLEKSYREQGLVEAGVTIINGVDASQVRVCGWVVPDTVAESPGEITFKVNDGTSTGIEVICNILSTDEKWLPSKLMNMINNAIPGYSTPGLLSSQIVVTGIIGVTPAGTLSIRSDHLYTSSDTHAVFYHPIAVAHFVLKGNVKATKPSSSGHMTLESLLSVESPILSQVDFRLEDNVENIIARAILVNQENKEGIIQVNTNTLISTCCEVGKVPKDVVIQTLRSKLNVCALMSTTEKDYEDGDEELPKFLYFLTDDNPL